LGAWRSPGLCGRSFGVAAGRARCVVSLGRARGGAGVGGTGWGACGVGAVCALGGGPPVACGGAGFGCRGVAGASRACGVRGDLGVSVGAGGGGALARRRVAGLRRLGESLTSRKATPSQDRPLLIRVKQITVHLLEGDQWSETTVEAKARRIVVNGPLHNVIDPSKNRALSPHHRTLEPCKPSVADPQTDQVKISEPQ